MVPMDDAWQGGYIWLDPGGPLIWVIDTNLGSPVAQKWASKTWANAPGSVMSSSPPAWGPSLPATGAPHALGKPVFH